jgi:hypothetical protein
MFDTSDAIRVIEDALDRQPYCPVCERPTTIHDEGGVLFLECPAVHPHGGLLARLGAAILGHLHQPLIELEMSAAA